MVNSDSEESLSRVRAKIDQLVEDVGPEVAGELARSFIDELPQTLSQLHNHLKDNDLVELKRAAHSFKSMAHFYGLEAVAQVSQSLEHDAAIEKTDQLSTLMEILEGSATQGAAQVADLFDAGYGIQIPPPATGRR